MTGQMGKGLAQLDAAQRVEEGVHVSRVPRKLEGEAPARWTAEATANMPRTAIVFMVQMRDEEGAR